MTTPQLIMDRMVAAHACVCWVSETPWSNSHIDTRRAAYWKARAVVVYDRVLRLIDDDVQQFLKEPRHAQT